jgi:hypothetical protein
VECAHHVVVRRWQSDVTGAPAHHLVVRVECVFWVARKWRVEIRSPK